MNQPTLYRRPLEPDALQARFALRVAARLDQNLAQLSPDLCERLRFAREQALERVRLARRADAQSVGGGAAALRWGGWGNAGSLWVKVGSVLPLVALVCGLVLIQRWHAQSQIDAAAEIDAALLSDDLPPSAYSDPGFAEFLNNGHE